MADQIVLVQLSDFHCVANPWNESFWSLPGRQGHSAMLAAGLPKAFEDVRILCEMSESEPLYIAMTGDLSCAGDQREFSTGWSLLTSKIKHPKAPPGVRGQELGLGFVVRNVLMVPGNHDHWANAQVLCMAFGACNLEIFGIPPGPAAPFSWPVWHEKRISSQGGFELQLFGVDTNSGFLQGDRNLDADGSIGDHEIWMLDKLLEQRPPRPSVRAVLAHHTTQGARSPFKRLPRPLDKRSKKLLLEVLARHRVRHLLTGHMHEFLAMHLEGQGDTVVELRCGTSIQGPAVGNREDQGFLVHRIRLEKKERRWHTWAYNWIKPSFERNADRVSDWQA